MADQPYYHGARVLFTATRPVSRDEFTKILSLAFSFLSKRRRGGILGYSIECEEMDEPEPGDPADLGSVVE